MQSAISLNIFLLRIASRTNITCSFQFEQCKMCNRPCYSGKWKLQSGYSLFSTKVPFVCKTVHQGPRRKKGLHDDKSKGNTRWKKTWLECGTRTNDPKINMPALYEPPVYSLTLAVYLFCLNIFVRGAEKTPNSDSEGYSRIMVGVTKKDKVATYKRNQECMILLKQLNQRSGDGLVTKQVVWQQGDKTDDGEVK